MDYIIYTIDNHEELDESQVMVQFDGGDEAAAFADWWEREGAMMFALDLNNNEE